MSCAPESVSVVIPVAAWEKTSAHEHLARRLKKCGFDVVVASRDGRAASLNHGARRAKKSILWFLHADSVVSDHNITALLAALAARPDALHYFDLGFSGGGLASLNAIGANMRSRLFGLPYGDQGLCISKKLFASLGGYSEKAPYGEDMLFVRHAARAGIRLNRIPSRLMTSPRKYHDRGWLALTLLRQWQMVRLLWMRI